MDLAMFSLYLHQVRTKRKPLEEKTIHSILGRVDYLLTFQDPITLESFQNVVTAKLNSGVTYATVNKYIQAVKHYGRFLHYEWVEQVKQYAEERGIPDRLSEEEMQRFLTVPRKTGQSEENYEKWQLFWHIAFFCGLRLSEIRTLKKDQVDFGNKLLLLRKTKTHPRVTTIITQVVTMVEKRLQNIEGEYLFSARHQPDIPMKYGAYLKDWAHRLDSIGVTRDIVPYDARHTAITRWIQELKLNIFEIKRLAGHRQISTTEHYYAFAGFDEVRKQQEKDTYFKGKETAKQKLKSHIDFFREGNFDEDERFDNATMEKAFALMWESIK